MGCDADYLRENGYESLLRGDIPDWEDDPRNAGEAIPKERFFNFREAKRWARKNAGRVIVRDPDGHGYLTKEGLLKKLENDELEREQAKHISISDSFSTLRFVDHSTIETVTIYWYHLLKENNFDYLVGELAEFIGQLVNLKAINIYDWDGKKLPKEIFELPNLISFTISSSLDISEFPIEIFQVKHLKELSIKSSDNISRIRNYAYEDCESNPLQECNRKDLLFKRCDNYLRLACNFSELEVLDIENCANIPDEISNLKNLCELNVKSCYSISANISKLTNLKKLCIYQCIEEYPNDIFKLINLDTLVLRSLKLCPASLGDLTNLSWLDLSYYEDEELPAEIGKLYKLNVLILNDTNIARLPAEIGNLSELNILSINWNYNLDDLPDELHKLKNLSEIHIHGSYSLYERIPINKNILPDLKIVSESFIS